MADLFASRQPMRLNDGTADANNAVIAAAPPNSGDYGLVVRQVGVSGAAPLADSTANPTTVITASATEIYNGGTWDRQRSVTNGQDTTGVGIAAAGILGQLDDTATGTVTENQFAPVRISTRRALLIEGVASGTAIATTVSGTVTVDTELPAAAALADATANPTVPTAGSALMGYNGTTWDRVRTANTGRLQVDVVTGGGGGTQYVGDAAATATPTGTMAMGLANAAAPTDVSANNDAVAAWHLRNGAAVVNLASGGTLVTLGQKAMASSLPVVIASDQSAVTVDSELPTAAALADATANPTVPGVGGFLMGYNGTTWDRVRVANTGRLQVDVITGGGSNASVLVDNAAFTDATSSVTAVGYYFDDVAGTALTENDIAAARIDSKRAQVLVIEDATTRGQRAAVSAGGALLVDTELPAAAALADATANPTVPTAGAALMGFNGTTWDRVRTANTGRLQVDVVTGGSSPPASEVPSGYNALIVYGTTSATASGATASVTTNTPANTKTFYVRSAMVSASGATKWQVKFGATVLATGFIPSSKLGELVRFDPPLTGTGDGTTALTIDVTNREASAMDLYARMGAIVLA